MTRPTLAERFWAKVDRRGSDECWPWTAACSAAGYGQIGEGTKKKFYGHRLSWEFANGPIPAGLSVCHTCDNPPCVNPAHLFLGTQADNLRDMAIKGRTATARLTPEIVRAIRAESGRGADQRLAARYGVSRAAVYAARRGITWRHVA